MVSLLLWWFSRLKDLRWYLREHELNESTILAWISIHFNIRHNKMYRVDLSVQKLTVKYGKDKGEAGAYFD